MSSSNSPSPTWRVTSARAAASDGVVAVRAIDDRFAGLDQQLGGAALIQDVEVRGDAGLERKALQQRLAEGVDGLDLHAAGRVEHAGKEPARRAPAILARRRVRQREQALVKLAVRHRRPPLQLRGDAVGHFRGRGLGEGQAEDARRRRSAQQQAEDAVRQHGRLAGAGGGIDPHRRLRIGGAALGRAGLLDDGGDRPAHSASPGPPADHSFTRARWA